MKKLIYLLALMLPLCSSAGLIKDPWFILNPEAGAGISVYRKVQYETQMGPFAGANLRFGKRVWVQAGANFMQHKLSAKLDTSVLQTGLQDLGVYYLNVPAVLGVSIINNKLFKYRIYAGYVYSLYLGASLENARTVTTDDFQKTVSSGRFGMGFDVWRFTLNANIDYGFTDVVKGAQNIGYVGFNAGLGFKLYPFKN